MTSPPRRSSTRPSARSVATPRAEEQAWPLVLIGSPRCSYVAGEVLNVDGGFQGARYTGRHQAGWADLIDGG